MAYVVPNTTIYLLSNVPLTKDYRDTFYFASLNEQQTYFKSKIAYTFTAQSYQRVNSNRLRVELNPAQNVYQCNYIMFANNSHWNGKFFYGFITRIDYINENCAEVTYEIDVIQTWFFDYTEEQCLIKRMSPKVDTVGSNLQPEPFDCGTYVCNLDDQPQNSEREGESFTGDYIGLLYLDNMENNDAGLFDNVLSAAKLYVYHADNNGVTAINNFIDGHISKTEDGVTSYYPNNIVGIYMMPHECFPKGQVPSNGMKVLTPKSNSRWVLGTAGVGPGTTVDGYTPKYMKLLTAPYTMLCVDMGNGQSQLYQYEFFNDPTDVRFACEANTIPPCSLTLFPVAYKHNPNNDWYCAEQISTGAYPLCSWSTDYWTAYLGMNSSLPLDETYPSSFATGMQVMKEGQSLVNLIEGGLTNPIGTGAKMATQLIGMMESNTRNGTADLNGFINHPAKTCASIMEGLASQNPAYRSSDIVKGTVYNGNNWYGHDNRRYIHFRRMSVCKEFAQKIDKYFDAFGYAVNDIDIPSRHNRRLYSYVQTDGCEVKGKITSEVRDAIANIYDGGIRFWCYATVGDNIGSYNINQNTAV